MYDIFACSVTEDIFTRTDVQSIVATLCIATVQLLIWKIPTSSPLKVPLRGIWNLI